MELERLPTYFLATVAIYAFLLLADLGYFIFAFLPVGFLSIEFWLLSLVMLLPLVLLAARWRTGFGKRHETSLGLAFSAAVLLDFLLNTAIFLPLMLG